jgi:hypothetical protein
MLATVQVKPNIRFPVSRQTDLKTGEIYTESFSGCPPFLI